MLKRVFSALDTKAFNSSFMGWASDMRELSPGEVMAVGGKTIKGPKKRSLPHIVAAFASGNGLTLGQVWVGDKTNEITAIPELLGLLDIEGTIVTTDAMGCQREIAESITEKGGDYILAVKGNQKGLQ